jgi:hypothetical protein
MRRIQETKLVKMMYGDEATDSQACRIFPLSIFEIHFMAETDLMVFFFLVSVHVEREERREVPLEGVIQVTSSGLNMTEVRSEHHLHQKRGPTSKFNFP